MIHAPEMRIIEAISVSQSVNDVDVWMTGCNIGVMGHVTTDHPCQSSGLRSIAWSPGKLKMFQCSHS